MRIKLTDKKVACLIWIVLWIPISLVFPSHAHFPIGGTFSPIVAFFIAFTGNSAQGSFSFDWQYVYFPALCFWLGAIAFVMFFSKAIKSLLAKTN